MTLPSTATMGWAAPHKLAAIYGFGLGFATATAIATSTTNSDCVGFGWSIVAMVCVIIRGLLGATLLSSPVIVSLTYQHFMVGGVLFYKSTQRHYFCLNAHPLSHLRSLIALQVFIYYSPSSQQLFVQPFFIHSSLRQNLISKNPFFYISIN